MEFFSVYGIKAAAESIFSATRILEDRVRDRGA